MADVTPLTEPITEVAAAQAAVVAGESHSLWYYSWRRLKRNKLAMSGLYMTIFIVLVAIAADIIAPFDPNLQVLEYSTMPSGFKGNIILLKNEVEGEEPRTQAIESFQVLGDQIEVLTAEGNTLRYPLTKLAGDSEDEWHKQPTYLLGTDRYGRDMLSRIMYGARVSLSVALFSELIAIIIGIFFGALAGFFRGWVDDLIMWFTNVIWSIPSILLVIAITIAWKPGFVPTIVAIGVTGWVDMARIVRGQFFSLREMEYVEATRALGLRNMRTIFRHVLPNALGPIIVIATAGFATAIIYEASLSFLGLGVQPPTSTWGQMIYDGYGFIAAGTNWGLTLYPALAIILAVFSFNFFGDGLRDAFDPKLKR